MAASAADTATPASAAANAAPASRMSFALPAPGAYGRHNGRLPIFVQSNEMDGISGTSLHASGAVRVNQGDLVLLADDLTHTDDDNVAQALGHVKVIHDGNIFEGPALTLQLDSLTGNFVSPRFWFARTQAGGQAQVVDFLGENKMRATQMSYSSCLPQSNPDGSTPNPDWILKARQVDLDFDKNEGKAQDAVVRFMDVPILAAPSLTFPLSNQRTTGLLPPSFYYDSLSGFQLATPFYWNIAPNQDATITPADSTRRGASLDLEYRFLLPHDSGTVHLFSLPEDELRHTSRGLTDITEKGTGALNAANGGPLLSTAYDLKLLRASDDDYWRDFSHSQASIYPRLFDSHAKVDATLDNDAFGLGDLPGRSITSVYASVQSWQTLKDLDPSADPVSSAITQPYRRAPQLGVRSHDVLDSGLSWNVQTEFDRFTNADPAAITGNRGTVAADVERPFDLGGIVLTPKAAVHGVSYDLDPANASPTTQLSPSSVIPTVSLDGAMSMERTISIFGHDETQTLEPHFLYVYTPYRDQSALPMFDTAPKDLNPYSVYTENSYSGGDRVSDANQITTGATTRLIDPHSGAETLRLGVEQKILLADQHLNPLGPNPITQRLSDLLLQASTSIIPHWGADSTVQYSEQYHETEQGTISVHYQPGAWRTITATYRYIRGSTDEVDLGWQWPFAGQTPPLEYMVSKASSTDVMDLNAPRQISRSNACGGTWYAVGHIQRSIPDGHTVDALAGVEYDAGCWIGRFVLEQVEVGSNKANTRVMVQLELLGLSQLALGANPLRSLRQNVPGYHLLRDEGKPLSTPGDDSSYDPNE